MRVKAPQTQLARGASSLSAPFSRCRCITSPAILRVLCITDNLESIRDFSGT